MLSFDAGDHYNAHTPNKCHMQTSPHINKAEAQAVFFVSKVGERASIGRVKLYVSSCHCWLKAADEI